MILTVGDEKEREMTIYALNEWLAEHSEELLAKVGINVTDGGKAVPLEIVVAE